MTSPAVRNIATLITTMTYREVTELGKAITSMYGGYTSRNMAESLIEWAEDVLAQDVDVKQNEADAS